MRLIDADELKGKAFADTDDGEHCVYCQDIDEAPTVDAVPVVRCRECEHMCRDNVGIFCKVWNGYNGCGYDGFCNYGERRTPDGEK